MPIFLHTVPTSLHDSFFVTVDLLICFIKVSFIASHHIFNENESVSVGKIFATMLLQKSSALI